MNAALSKFNSSETLICAIDSKGTFVEINDACKAILGYDKQEMLGHQFTEFLHPDFVTLSTEAKNLIFKRGYISHFSNSYISKNGTAVVIDWSAQKVTDNLIRCTGRLISNEDDLMLYQLSFRENPTAMFLYDPISLRILNVNLAACNLYNYTEAEFLQLKVTDIKPPTDENEFKALVQEYVKRQVTELPDVHINKSGVIMDVIVWGKTIDLRNKTVRLVSIRDITDIKKNEAQLKLFAGVMTNVADGVLITDAKARTLYINPAFEKLSEYTSVEVLFKNPLNFLTGPQTDTRQLKKLERTLALGEAFAGEIIHYTKSGKPFWVSMSIAPVRNENGDPEYFISVMRDITAFRKADNEKKALAQDLLRSSSELKQFSYITAHNFRAPLTNIMAILQLVEQSKMNDEDKRWLKLLKNSAVQLNDTINDLVNILIVRESVKVEKTLMDIRPVIERVLHNYAAQLKDIHATTLISFDEPFVRFHPAYLSTIADQVVNNAIKFRSADRPLVIRIHSKKTDKATFIIFSDNGTGADPLIIQDRIFGLYQKFHEHTPGKGLGLFAVKAEAEALGATVEAITNMDAGFELRLCIPNE